MPEIKALIRPNRLDDVLRALHEMPELPGVTVSKVHAFGRNRPRVQPVDAAALETDLIKLEIVVTDEMTERVVNAGQQAAQTGRPGDGIIFLSSVRDALRIRSGEHGPGALWG